VLPQLTAVFGEIILGRSSFWGSEFYCAVASGGLRVHSLRNLSYRVYILLFLYLESQWVRAGKFWSRHCKRTQ